MTDLWACSRSSRQMSLLPPFCLDLQSTPRLMTDLAPSHACDSMTIWCYPCPSIRFQATLSGSVSCYLIDGLGGDSVRC